MPVSWIGMREQIGDGVLVGLRSREADPELTSRPDQHAGAPDLDGDRVRLAVAIAGLGLETEQVIAGQFRRHPRERKVRIRKDAKQLAATYAAHELQALLSHASDPVIAAPAFAPARRRSPTAPA